MYIELWWTCTDASTNIDLESWQNFRDELQTSDELRPILRFSLSENDDDLNLDFLEFLSFKEQNNFEFFL